MSSTVFHFFRVPHAMRVGSHPRVLRVAGVCAAVGLGSFALYYLVRPADLPEGVRGTVVFVSDRSGIDSLYVRHLPDGRAERLVRLAEPIGEPALSPDGRQVAFAVGGRIGLVSVTGGAVNMLTAGTDWKDESPAWRPDGRAVVVAARAADSENRDIHEIRLEGATDVERRRPLVQTPLLDESQPVVSPDGAHVVFVRDEHLYRWDTADGHVRRISGGLRKARAPRILASGRVLFLWTQGKEYGIDVMDIDGRECETLQRGTAFYRTVAPSPDGRFLAATFTYDLGFHSWQALQPSHQEQLRLLDVHGAQLSDFGSLWRSANHSADWGR